MSSGGPGNFATVVDFCETEGRAHARVAHLVTDRPGIPAIEFAQSRGIEHTVLRFANISPASPEFRERRARDCDRLLGLFDEIEGKVGRIDLVVSAFRRVLAGEIVTRLTGRLINVHPADLSVIDRDTRQRRYVGIEGLARSLRDGNMTTRTTIHYIDAGVDTGPIICLGPKVAVAPGESVEQHETRQKIESDRPALTQALRELLVGRSAGSGAGMTSTPDATWSRSTG